MDSDALFTFHVEGLPEDTFQVVSFTGTEGVSRLYDYQVELVSRRDDIDLDQTASGKAALTLRLKPKDAVTRGMLARLEQTRSAGGYAFYQALLVPRLWGLTLTSHNQIFLDQAAPDFLAGALTDSGELSANDFEFRLTRDYPPREYVCQYNESHYAFFARWLEREGMYYFFEHAPQGEKLIVADNRIAHAPAPGFPPLRYLDVRGGDVDFRTQACTEFIYEQNKLPSKVRVKDYNYRTPALELNGESVVDQAGLGELYVYGGNVKTPSEAKRQAAIRAEAEACLKKRYRGRSSAAFLRPGFLFQLQGHYRQDANADYLPLLVKHEGSQTAYLLAGLGRCMSDRPARDHYSNTFLALPSTAQYRHPRQTPWPRFHGAVTAMVDAEGSGQYAEMDGEGRYKVRLPFDMSGRPDGKASSFIRMAEPYAGENCGMHFPLHKGTEVLLTFADGDVDRPIIAAAMPNLQRRSVVRDENFPANILRSASGNLLVMGDKQGQEFIGLASPFHKSGMALGSVKPGGGGSITLATEGDYDIFTLGAHNSGVVGAANKLVVGTCVTAGVGLKADISGGMSFKCDLGTSIQYAYGSSIAFGDTCEKINTEVRQTGLDSITLSAGASEDVAGLARQAKQALGLGMAGTLVASAGVVAACRPKWDDMSKGVEEDSAGFIVGGSATAAIGLALASVGCHKTRDLAKRISDMKARQCASEITLDNNGVRVSVDGEVSPGARFLAEVSHGAGLDQSSLINITERGNGIVISNKTKSRIEMHDGRSVLIKSGERSSLELGQGKMRMKFVGLEQGPLRINGETGVIEMG